MNGALVCDIRNPSLELKIAFSLSHFKKKKLMLFDSTLHSFLDMFTGNDKQRLHVNIGKTEKNRIYNDAGLLNIG